MVSQPSGPLHHRPLPTTWLPVPEGGGQRAGTMLVYLTPTTFLGTPSIPGVCMCGAFLTEGQEGRGELWACVTWAGPSLAPSLPFRRLGVP